MDDVRGETTDLIERTRLGDQEALAELFGRYRARLKRIVGHRLDPRLATRLASSDVLQDVYLDAYKRIRHYSATRGMSFFAWLRWILNQRVTDLHRRHLVAKRRDAARVVSLERRPDPATSRGRGDESILGSMSSPSAIAIRNEAFARVEWALARLEPGEQELLELRHYQEMSNNDVALKLGVSPAAASKRYIRALKRLKDMIAEPVSV